MNSLLKILIIKCDRLVTIELYKTNNYYFNRNRYDEIINKTIADRNK